MALGLCSPEAPVFLAADGELTGYPGESGPVLPPSMPGLSLWLVTGAIGSICTRLF